MINKIIGIEESRIQYEKFLKTRRVDPEVIDVDYKNIREYCLMIFDQISSQVIKGKSGKSSKHEIDMLFGIALYNYFNKLPGFIDKYAANHGFWRYIAVYIIPDIIAKRWDLNKKDHFYSKATAIYPFQVYWYIHLSYQGSSEATIEILKDNQEDHILQLVDRPSSIGVNLDLYRKIMKKLANFKPETRKNIFRTVMMRNTSKLVNLRPEIFPGGVDAYVAMLFEEIQ